ncbi:uncharacterized protein LOC130896777 [Diorhabda carinulata]|uniref:uncharacterized protein LOC130896777 n=1 Tax=Diorhabda carinulata TaxID=1163345 RepID=UPI0025A2244B|nr:uncharacterized protein LOC130896777 [Diorhabda carinulata]
MDSFLEPSISVPEPTPIDKYIFRPVVPEVSMISNTKTSLDEFSSQENLLQMKRFDTSTTDNAIPVGYRTLQAQFAKKQVRFESPTSQINTHKPLSSDNRETIASSYQNFSAIRKQVPPNNPKPFEQIYMANIPDRKLDLSLIDLPKRKLNVVEKSHNSDNEVSKNVDLLGTDNEESSSNTENKENKTPKTYQDYLELQKKIISKRKMHNDSVTDIFNYKRNQNCDVPKVYTENGTISDVQQKYDKVFNVIDDNQLQKSEVPNPIYNTSVQTWLSRNPQSETSHLQSSNPQVTKSIIKQKCDMETQTCPSDVTDDKALETKKYSEPNTSDLLKIIAQQNEQLLILQKQVALLLERDRNYTKPIEAPIEDRKVPETKTCTMNSTPQKKHFRQENMITRQSSIFQDNQRKWGMSKFSINLTTSFDMPIRSQQKQNFFNNEPQIQEITESDTSRKNDNHLEQSLHLQEPVNVREQCPSPQPSININMNDYESSDEESSSEIGASFYNNLMGQVNNILKKAHLKNEKVPEDETLDKVKEATLKHLKNLGITVDDRTDFVRNNGNYSPSEISLTVKQLLMKYLPKDQGKQQEKGFPGVSEGVLEARPEFSMASLEYMKKYNLIASKGTVPDIINQKNIERNGYNNQEQNRRILDLTALKMQPKLL